MNKEEKTNKREIAIERLTDAINRLNNNDFNIYFFVMDSKGKPVGSIAYIYEVALSLHNRGYKVKMLHNEKDFVGPYEWMGEEYSVLEHANTEKDGVRLNASDVLVIPEIYIEMMAQLAKDKAPCKKVMLLQNMTYFTEFMPASGELSNLGIYDVITTTEALAEEVKGFFPSVKTYVIPRAVQKYFVDGEEPRKIVINVLANSGADKTRIVKQFYWKYPEYRWVSFMDLSSLPKREFARYLRENAITVWADDNTDFGQSCVEALCSGSIVIGKIPEKVPEWMYDKETSQMKFNGLWLDSFDSIHEYIAKTVRAWINDTVPEEMMENVAKMKGAYPPEAQDEAVADVFCDQIVGGWKREIVMILDSLRNSEKNKNIKEA